MRVTARARMRGAHSVGLARAAFGSRLPGPEFEVARHQRARPHARSQESPAAKECVDPLGARAQQAGLAVAGCHLTAPQVEDDVNEKNTTPHLRRRARATAPEWTTCKRVAGGARARTRANTRERASERADACAWTHWRVSMVPGCALDARAVGRSFLRAGARTRNAGTRTRNAGTRATEHTHHTCKHVEQREPRRDGRVDAAKRGKPPAAIACVRPHHLHGAGQLHQRGDRQGQHAARASVHHCSHHRDDGHVMEEEERLAGVDQQVVEYVHLRCARVPARTRRGPRVRASEPFASAIAAGCARARAACTRACVCVCTSRSGRARQRAARYIPSSRTA